MRVKGVVILTGALFFATIGFIFHILAIFGKRWIVAIPKHSELFNDRIHYYGLWSRCQYYNTTFATADVTFPPIIENFICRPNTYLRYNTNTHSIAKNCYDRRHDCDSTVGVPSDCKCQYLTVTKIQQGCSIVAAICILLAIFISYLKIIASPENTNARFVLSCAPILLFSLALLLMIITMILVGIYLRRNEYEDYDIKLPKSYRETLVILPETVNHYQLRAFFEKHKDPDLYRKAMSEFKIIHQRRFRTRIDMSAGAEIFAILLIFVAEILSIIIVLATAT